MTSCSDMPTSSSWKTARFYPSSSPDPGTCILSRRRRSSSSRAMLRARGTTPHSTPFRVAPSAPSHPPVQVLQLAHQRGAGACAVVPQGARDTTLRCAHLRACGNHQHATQRLLYLQQLCLQRLKLCSDHRGAVAHDSRSGCAVPERMQQGSHEDYCSSCTFLALIFYIEFFADQFLLKEAVCDCRTARACSLLSSSEPCTSHARAAGQARAQALVPATQVP